MISHLEPWSFQLKSGFSLRGWRSRWSGKPVIHFLHGNGFCGLTYQPMLEILAKDFDLLITDLPGHGDSDTGSHFAGWNGTSQYAMTVLNHFSQQLSPITPVFGLGHSYGGVLTALMAGRDPKRFRKTLLLDPVLFSNGMISVMKVADIFGLLGNSKMSKKAKERTQHWASREEAFDSFKDRGGFKGWTDAALQSYVDYALADTENGVSLKCPVKVEAKIFGSYPKNLWSYLKKMKTPCKILVAEGSFPFIARSVDKLKDIRAYSSDSVPGGHCFMQEDPELAAKLVKEWFLDDACSRR